MIKRTIVTIVVLFCFSCGDKKNKDVNFFIVNNSNDIPVVDLKVYVDEKVIIEDSFKVSDISPNDRLFVESLKWGRHKLKIEDVNNEIVQEREIIVDDSLLNVFISFDYHKLDSNEIKVLNELNRLINSPEYSLNKDTVSIPKRILIHTVKGKVVLH